MLRVASGWDWLVEVEETAAIERRIFCSLPLRVNIDLGRLPVLHLFNKGDEDVVIGDDRGCTYDMERLRPCSRTDGWCSWQISLSSTSDNALNETKVPDQDPGRCR